jgi:hypothetical protein
MGKQRMTNSYQPTQVDLDRLREAADTLEEIQRFVQTHCIGAMPPISQSLGSTTNIDMSDVEYRFTREATVFGGFYSAYGMQAKHDEVYRSVQMSLESFSQHLAEVAETTRTMVANYEAVEQRNVEMAEDFQRALGGPGTGGTNYVV